MAPSNIVHYTATVIVEKCRREGSAVRPIHEWMVVVVVVESSRIE